MRTLYYLYTWLIFIPLFVIETMLFGVLCLLLSPLLSPRQLGFTTAVLWSRIGLLLGWDTVNVQGREHIDPTQSYVVVANHLSLFDIWVLYGSMNMDLRWVAKKEVRYIPIIGVCCTALGHIFIDRRNREHALQALQKARARIIRGTSILFFPEGTRSRNGTLQPFKKGAFHIAQDVNLPVLPVSILGTHDILPSDTSRLTPARQVTLVIHPPISLKNHEADDLKTLSQRAIQSALSAP